MSVEFIVGLIEFVCDWEGAVELSERDTVVVGDDIVELKTWEVVEFILVFVDIVDGGIVKFVVEVIPLSEVDIAVDIIVLCVVGVELEDIVEEEVVQEFVAVDIAGDIVVLGATKGVNDEDIEVVVWVLVVFAIVEVEFDDIVEEEAIEELEAGNVVVLDDMKVVDDEVVDEEEESKVVNVDNSVSVRIVEVFEDIEDAFVVDSLYLLLVCTSELSSLTQSKNRVSSI